MRNFKKKFRLFSVFLAAVFFLLDLSSCSLQRAARPGSQTVSAAKVEGPVNAVQASFDPEGHLNAAIGAKKLGLADKAASELKEIRAQSPGTVWYRRASFLLGMDSMERGEPDATYFKDAEGLPHMDDYLLFYQAKALLKKGEPMEAAFILDSLITRYPDSVLRAESLYAKAAALSAVGDYDSAEREFSRFISGHPENPLVPEALLGSARASLMLKKTDAAAEAAMSVIVEYPARPASKEARALLDEIRSEGGTVRGMTDGERFARGKRFFSAARYTDAIAEFSALSGKSEGPYRDSSVIKLAVSLMRLKRYERAEKTLKDYLDGQGAKRELDALYLLAQVALRRGKEDLLLDAGKRIARKYPKSPEWGRVLLFTGQFYESKDPDRSLSSYARALDEFKDAPSTVALDALWDMGWAAYRAGKYEDALARFSSYGQYECRDESRFLYWSGRSAENLGKAGEAEDFYGRLCGGFNDTYYCRMAEARLKALAASGAVNGAPLPPDGAAGPSVYYGQTGLYSAEMPEVLLKVHADDHYLAARELLAMGLGSMASKEIDFITKKYSAEPKEAFELAQTFVYAGDYYNALRVYSLYLSGDRARECGKSPSDLMALSFPPQVVDLIKETDPESQDPFLVAAVMREESNFNPRAVSITGALGLMQIMPSTGRNLARELGEEDFDSKELFDPKTNVRYGARYLDELSKAFDNNAILAIASYNAGPDAAARWKDAFHLAPDEFIESIPYPETRNYTKKVLKSYFEYLRLSGVSNPFERIAGPASNENPDAGVN